MTRLLHGLLAFSLLVTGAAARGGDPDAKKEVAIPFETFGKRFQQAHCKASAGDAPCPVAEIRSQHYVHGLLGAFDAAYPAATLAEKDRVEEFRSIARGLLEAQSRWIDWLAKDDTTAAKADIATLQEWVKAWKPGVLAKAKSAKEKELFAMLEANEAQAAAAKRLSEFLLKPAALGIAPKKKEPVRLLFAPKRSEFIELAGYAGLLDAKQQAALWKPIVGQWTSFWLGWDLVLALEYPAWKEDPEFKNGLSMNKFEETGIQQHVIQQAMQALMWHCCGDGDSTYLQQSVALNLAIAVCGEANALEGNSGHATTGASTAPYEMFVPGGLSTGGTLPPIPAAPLDSLKENQWRIGRGADHFAGPLREGMKNGQKQLQKDRPDKMDPVLARDRYAHFAILGEDEVAKMLVSAPFLGKLAMEKPYPPQEFLIDFKEFFRAYRTAFFHWLQEKGDPAGEAESKAKFREMLVKTATRPAKTSFEAVISDVYKVPLSGKNGETDSLEWRFLEWLGKGAK
jgi:hypothetical protein